MADTPEKSADTMPPLSLGEAAQQVRHRIESSTDILRGEFRAVLEQEMYVRKLMRALQTIVTEGTRSLNRIRELLIQKRGLPEKDINAEVAAIRSDRDQSLFTEDFSSVRDFYDKVEGKIVAAEGLKSGMTDHEQRRMAAEEMSNLDIGAYVQTHFADVFLSLLGRPYNSAEHDAFKQQVLKHILEKHTLTEPQQEATLRHRIRNFFDDLRLLAGKKGDLAITPAVIYGILGRVLSKDEMQQVFEGDLHSIEVLPSGRMRISFADDNVEFYHEEHAPVPEEIRKRIDGEIPFRILFVHFRPEDDVRLLFHKMSDGQIMEAEFCNGEGCVKVRGKSGTEDFDVENLPQGVSKEKFAATPMKYLKHDLRFSLDGTAPEA
jgi:hypothetical protein